jgi:hypothetical protein
MESLKKIINEIFSIDIDSEKRKRSVVDGRRVYSKILRDLGYVYEDIGDSLGKDHATVIHYIKTIDSLLNFDSVFNKKYNICKKKFLLENRKIIMKSNDDIHLEAISLAERLEKAILERNQLLSKFVGHLESYKKENKKMPNIEYCKEVILPLFDL